MKKLVLATALLSTFAFTAARAEDGCDVPKDKWKSEEAMRQQAKAMGLKVSDILVKNGCYQIIAIDSNGRPVERTFNPETGEQVGAEGQM